MCTIFTLYAHILFTCATSTSIDNKEEKRRTYSIDNNIMELEFNTHKEVFEWYNRYTRCIGFGVMKDDCGKDSKEEIK